ncbi:MAG: hypothetical protein FWB91_11520 [Defluviitaleaceae bacterium]|nr:hypothetical protein [Defluviitaleaceae bacterium]
MEDKCVIAYKAYESCRCQNCLTSEQLGPARAACRCSGPCRGNGDIIIAPSDTAFVTADNLRIENIRIVHKQPNSLRAGYWDVRVKFVFEYLLTFWGDDGCVISQAEAANTFVMKKTIFGLAGDGRVIGTDLCGGESTLQDTKPFVMVKGKAVALDVNLQHGECYGEVHVSIGLFSDIALFRPTGLCIQARACGIPSECEDTALSPCDYFMADKKALLDFTAGESGLNEAARSLNFSAPAKSFR